MLSPYAPSNTHLTNKKIKAIINFIYEFAIALENNK